MPQAAIKSANGLKDASKLKLGQVLKVPPREESRPGPVVVAVGESKPTLTRDQTVAAVTERVRSEAAVSSPRGKRVAVARLHKVRSGQTLGEIAKRYKVSVAELRSANGLNEKGHIRVGQQLKIPAS